MDEQNNQPIESNNIRNTPKRLSFFIIPILFLIIVIAFMVVFRFMFWYFLEPKPMTGPGDLSNTISMRGYGLFDSPLVRDFPIPVFYEKYKWDFISDIYDPYGQGHSPRPIIDLYPIIDTGESFSKGAFYVATNTDPGITSWHEYLANAPKNEDANFYSGDTNFLDYYDEQLRSLGYDRSRIYLDKDFNVITEGEATYSFMSTGDGDGPIGTSRGYLKYDNGKARVVIISSDTSKNSIFISNVLDIRNFLSSSGALSR